MGRRDQVSIPFVYPSLVSGPCATPDGLATARTCRQRHFDCHASSRHALLVGQAMSRDGHICPLSPDRQASTTTWTLGGIPRMLSWDGLPPLVVHPVQAGGSSALLLQSTGVFGGTTTAVTQESRSGWSTDGPRQHYGFLVIFSALSLDFTSLAASLGSLRVRLYRLLRRLGICSVTLARIIRLRRLRPRVHSLDLAADGLRSLESTSLACNILRLPLGIRHPNQSQSSARPRVQVLGGRRARSVLWLPIPVASRLGFQTVGRMTARRRS